MTSPRTTWSRCTTPIGQQLPNLRVRDIHAVYAMESPGRSSDATEAAPVRDRYIRDPDGYHRGRSNDGPIVETGLPADWSPINPRGQSD
jgi:hypothetical protein